MTYSKEPYSYQRIASYHVGHSDGWHGMDKTPLPGYSDREFKAYMDGHEIGYRIHRKRLLIALVLKSP